MSAKVVNGLVKNPTFEELIGSGGSDIRDIGLYTRTPASSFQNFFFAPPQGPLVDDDHDDNVSKILALLRAKLDIQHNITVDRRENNRRL